MIKCVRHKCGRYLVGFRPELDKFYKEHVKLHKALIGFPVAHVKDKDSIPDSLVAKTFDRLKKIAEVIKGTSWAKMILHTPM